MYSTRFIRCPRKYKQTNKQKIKIHHHEEVLMLNHKQRVYSLSRLSSCRKQKQIVKRFYFPKSFSLF